MSPLWQAVLRNGTGGAVARLCRAALRAQRFSSVPHAAAPGPEFQGLRRPGTACRGAPVLGDGAASALIACNALHAPGDRDDSQTTTSAGCLRQLPGPLRAADAGRGHRPTPTDGARAAQRCKLLVLGLPKRCYSHTMLVRKALACAVTRFLSLLLSVTTPCDLNVQGEAPADPSAP